VLPFRHGGSLLLAALGAPFGVTELCWDVGPLCRELGAGLGEFGASGSWTDDPEGNFLIFLPCASFSARLVSASRSSGGSFWSHGALLGCGTTVPGVGSWAG
jgi:hypothetical protein